MQLDPHRILVFGYVDSGNISGLMSVPGEIEVPVLSPAQGPQPVPCAGIPRATAPPSKPQHPATSPGLCSSLEAAPCIAAHQEYVCPLILLTTSHQRAQYRQTGITSIYLASILLVKLKIKIKPSLYSY